MVPLQLDPEVPAVRGAAQVAADAPDAGVAQPSTTLAVSVPSLWSTNSSSSNPRTRSGSWRTQPRGRAGSVSAQQRRGRRGRVTVETFGPLLVRWMLITFDDPPGIVCTAPLSSDNSTNVTTGWADRLGFDESCRVGDAAGLRRRRVVPQRPRSALARHPHGDLEHVHGHVADHPAPVGAAGGLARSRSGRHSDPRRHKPTTSKPDHIKRSTGPRCYAARVRITAAFGGPSHFRQRQGRERNRALGHRLGSSRQTRGDPPSRAPTLVELSDDSGAVQTIPGGSSNVTAPHKNQQRAEGPDGARPRRPLRCCADTKPSRPRRRLRQQSDRVQRVRRAALRRPERRLLGRGASSRSSATPVSDVSGASCAAPRTAGDLGVELTTGSVIAFRLSPRRLGRTHP